MPRPRHRRAAARGVALALLVIAAVPTAFMLTMLVRALNGVGPPRDLAVPNLDVPTSTSSPLTTVPAGQLLGYGSKVAPATVTLLFERLDRDAQQVSVTASIWVPDSLFRGITDIDSRPVVKRRWDGLHLTRLGRGASLELRIMNVFAGAPDVTERVPLTAFFRTHMSDTTMVSVPLVLPLQGQPQDFPDDWYQFVGHVVLVPSGDLRVERPSYSADLPLTLAYGAGPAMRGTRLRVRSDARTDAAHVNVAIRTDRESRAIAYLTAAIPAVLAAVALLLLFVELGRREAVRRGQDVALAVVLGVLAVLPIRQVTVPSDLDGLTRIDLLLAFGVVSAVSVLLLAIAVHLWRELRARGEGSSGSVRRAPSR